MLILALSATLESPTLKKSIFRNDLILRNYYNLILRNCGTIKLQSTELGYKLNLMSQPNYIFHVCHHKTQTIQISLP